MSRVTTLVTKAVERLQEEKVGDTIHQQTVKISQKRHHALRALAECLQTHKSTIASELLEAAIPDALEALPSRPMRREDYPADVDPDAPDVPKTFREFVKWRGEQYYEEFCVAQLSGDTQT